MKQYITKKQGVRWNLFDPAAVFSGKRSQPTNLVFIDNLNSIENNC